MEDQLTSFDSVFKIFQSLITDDMYLEITKEETVALQNELLLGALPYFEFPRKDIFDLNEEQKTFNVSLSREEQTIIATYMVVGWIGQQLANVDVTRMFYTGADFKATSQANHMHKLMQLKKTYMTDGFHLQRLYKRRKADAKGIMRSTFGEIMENHVSDTINEV